MNASHPPIVVMGVQGSGKSTVAALLAQRLGVRFIDGDELHSAQNKAAMAAGIPLTDQQRDPWLRRIGRRLAGADGGIVIVCSALKRSYRDLLRSYAPGLFLVFLDGDMGLIAQRISQRQHEYMPPSLLATQFETLEVPGPDERGISVDIRIAPQAIVDQVAHALATSDPTTHPHRLEPSQ